MIAIIYANKYNNIDLIKRKFFQFSIYFNDFNDISNEDIEKIKEDVKIWNKKIFSTVTNNQKNKTYLSLYLAILSFLSDSNYSKKNLSYDEKIVFLILAFDPNLEVYNLFISYPLMSMGEINKASEDKRSEFKTKRDKQLMEIQNAVREKFGFYDSHLINYEAKFLKKFKSNELITSIKHTYFDKFFSKMQKQKNFDDISKDEHDNLILKAEDYLSKYSDVNHHTLAYQILFQSDILKLQKITEKIIFFILVMDKELNLLKIYWEENNWEEIKRRALEEVGFYSRELVLLEKAYQEKFIPDYKPVWTKKEQ